VKFAISFNTDALPGGAGNAHRIERCKSDDGRSAAASTRPKIPRRTSLATLTS
jgi:hypothetical protein